MPADPGHRTHSLSVSPRAARAVVVVPADLPGTEPNQCHSSVHRALEWVGRLWGGAHDLVVPAIEDSVPPIFHALCGVYDPDVIVPWVVTAGELSWRDEAAAEAHAEGLYAAFGHQVPDQSPGLHRDITQVRTAADARQACADLVATQNPFPSTVDERDVAFHMQLEVPRPLSTLADLGRSTAGAAFSSLHAEMATWPPPAESTVTDIDLTGCPPWLSTVLKMRLGVIGAGEAARDDLSPTDQVNSGWPFDHESPTEFARAVTVAFRGLSLAGHEDNGWSSPTALAATPLRRGQVNLAEYTYSPDARSTFLLVVGDSEADGLLYMCWQRVYGDESTAWVDGATARTVIEQAAGTEETINVLVTIVDQMLNAHPWRTFERGWITSFSWSTAQLQAALDALRAQSMNSTEDGAWDLVVASPDEIRPPARSADVVVDPGTFGSASTIAFSHGSADTPLRSPVPASAAGDLDPRVLPLRAHWVAETLIGGCLLPRRTAAISAAVSDDLDGDVRCARDGVAWIGQNRRSLPAGANAEHQLSEVGLLDPTMPRLIDSLLQKGWSWQLSSAGRFYDGFAQMCDGLSSLSGILRDPFARAALSAFAGDAGVGAESRRYLRLSDLRSAAAPNVPTVEVARETVDRFCRQGLLTRGLVLKCPRCRHTAFHSLAEVGQKFTCRRCSTEHHIDAQTWCHVPPHEPAWFYRLDELVYQALREHVEGPVMALHQLGASGAGCRHSWAIELAGPGGDRVELDFVALVDGHLFAGEAKTNGKLGSGSERTAHAEIRNTVRAARLLQADTVVFATTTPTWRPASRSALDAYRSTRRDILVIEDAYHSAPPRSMW